MKIEDPLSPSGDQHDLNKLRRIEQPLCVLGRKPVLCPFLQPGLLLQGEGVGGVHRDPCSGGGHGSRTTWPPESLHTCASFIGAAGWVSASWSQGWRAAVSHLVRPYLFASPTRPLRTDVHFTSRQAPSADPGPSLSQAPNKLFR